MYGTPKDFDEIQWKGAMNVASASKNAGAQLIHFSAIGADKTSSIPYTRTKGLAEESVFEIYPDATIIRPSLVFGPGDGFFNVGILCNVTRVTLNVSPEICSALENLTFSSRIWRWPSAVPASICR